jgi:hypothetical protein
MVSAIRYAVLLQTIARIIEGNSRRRTQKIKNA